VLEAVVVVGEVVVFGVTFDGVLASLELVSEGVEFDEVDAVFLDVDVTSVFVVFGTDEDAYDGFDWFLADYVDLVGEWFAVKTLLTNADVVVEVFVFFFVDEDGVADVGVVVLEVGDETVYVHAFYLDTWEFEIGLVVVWQEALVFLEVEDDALVELVEDWVAEGGFEVFQSGWGDLVFVEWLLRVAQEMTSEHLEVSVVAGVGRFGISFDEVAKSVESFFFEKFYNFAVFGLYVAGIDGVADSSFVVLD